MAGCYLKSKIILEHFPVTDKKVRDCMTHYRTTKCPAEIYKDEDNKEVIDNENFGERKKNKDENFGERKENKDGNFRKNKLNKFDCSSVIAQLIAAQVTVLAAPVLIPSPDSAPNVM